MLYQYSTIDARNRQKLRTKPPGYVEIVPRYPRKRVQPGHVHGVLLVKSEIHSGLPV